MKNKKYYDSFLNMICEVEWLDAESCLKQNLSEIDKISPSSLLIPVKTYGIIHKVDDIALIILQEKSTEECDYTCIPLSLILNIRELN